MSRLTDTAADMIDAAADETIRECMDLAARKSFFLYAGAGSGKTRSLVSALEFFIEKNGRQLSLNGQRVGVITYTNAACDEIRQRLEFDARAEVSTIHSFAWSLIRGYDSDIRKWVSANLLKQIADLEGQQARGRRGTKASADRDRSIESKQRRLSNLDQIRRFVYSPTGENRTRDALNHAEIIAMTADFLNTKAGLRRLLVSRFPVLLIDESQDTARRLMDAFLDVQAQNEPTFCLGLFGDTMQRIYGEGKEDLAGAIPAAWARPRKLMNHRCPARVIRLLNKIRSDVDGQPQRGRLDKPEGHVRLFLVPSNTADKFAAEAKIRDRMAEITGDELWAAANASVKTLTLEHHMAAARFGFEEFFDALYAVDRMRTSLLEGSVPGVAFFTRDLLPLIDALRAGDRYRAAAIVRKASPLFDRLTLETAGAGQVRLVRAANDATKSLYALFSGPTPPATLSVLRNVAESGLFAIPESLLPFVSTTDQDGDDADVDEDANTETVAWRRALETSFDQIEKYDRYVRHESPFDTHQGVKGLEFPRVMVIISDEEARGFMFSYSKLFGTTGASKTDAENEASGRDTSMDRTRRLFYVTCSRAEESLAVVYYASDPALIRAAAIERAWFDPFEVEGCA
jgi:DNA helicase-2/ATP-dependent DNA helicase PcrA